jgi:hypothetical protein
MSNYTYPGYISHAVPTAAAVQPHAIYWVVMKVDEATVNHETYPNLNAAMSRAQSLIGQWGSSGGHFL